MTRAVLSLLVLSAAFGCVAQPRHLELDEDFTTEQASSSHPVNLYYYAARLANAGEMNEAAFWFYAGQLRYRIYLMAEQDVPADDERALFSSLNDNVGLEINTYLGGDPQEWEDVIERVLEWDQATANEITPREQFPAAHAEIRAGLETLLEFVRNNHDEIRAQRAARGLENRNTGGDGDGDKRKAHPPSTKDALTTRWSGR